MGNSHTNKLKKKDLINNTNSLKKEVDNLHSELRHIKSLQFSKFDNNIITELDAPFENIIFEGGGVKGIAYCGALCRLDELGLLKNAKRYAGSSIGSICACLLAIGYSPCEIENIIKNTNFNDFLDNQIGYVRDFYNLLNDFGYCSGDYLYNWIGTLIKRKTGNPNYTFNDLWTTTQTDLVITGTNLSKLNTQYYSYRNNPHMKIRDAIRISISIPFVFKPIKWDDDTLIDGGIIDNYPLHIFDGEYPGEVSALQCICNPNWNTIGLKLHASNEEKTYELIKDRTEIDGIQSFTYSLINILCKAIEQKQIRDTYWLRSIIINTGEIDTTQFDLTDKQKDFLIEQGRIAVDNFIEYRNNIKDVKK